MSCRYDPLIIFFVAYICLELALIDIVSIFNSLQLEFHILIAKEVLYSPFMIFQLENKFSTNFKAIQKGYSCILSSVIACET